MPPLWQDLAIYENIARHAPSRWMALIREGRGEAVLFLQKEPLGAELTCSMDEALSQAGMGLPPEPVLAPQGEVRWWWHYQPLSLPRGSSPMAVGLRRWPLAEQWAPQERSMRRVGSLRRAVAGSPSCWIPSC